MPKLRSVVEKIDDIEEPFRQAYTQGQDGKYYLDADFEESVAFRSLKEEKKRLAERMKEYEGIDPKKAREVLEAGIDVEEYKQWKAQEEERQRKAAEEDERRKREEGKFDELTKQMQERFESERNQLVERHAKEVQELKQELERKQSLLFTTIAERDAIDAIQAEGGEPLLLLPHVRQLVQVIEHEGHYVPRVTDGKGNIRIGDSKGTPMTIRQLVQEMKDDPRFGRAFAGTGASGTTARAGNKPGPHTKKRSEMTIKEKADFIKQHGAEAFNALPYD